MAMFQETKKKKEVEPAKPDIVKRIQEVAAAEHKRKTEEDAKKKKGVDTSPSQGILSRMYDMVVGKKSEKK